MSPAKVVSEWVGDSYARRVTLMGGACTATITAVLAVMHLGSIAEPFWIATRQFTRDIVSQAERRAEERDRAGEQRDKDAARRVITIEIAIKEADRGRLQGQIDRLELEIRKMPPDASDSLRQAIADQVRNYSDQIRRLDRDLEELYRQLSGRRP